MRIFQSRTDRKALLILLTAINITIITMMLLFVGPMGWKKSYASELNNHNLNNCSSGRHKEFNTNKPMKRNQGVLLGALLLSIVGMVRLLIHK